MKSRVTFLAATAAAAVMAVAGCGTSSSTTTGSASTGSAASGPAAASSRGAGQLVIYSNAGLPYFQPVLSAFGKAYPSIKVSYSDVEDPVAFAKYRAEHAQGARTADVIIASSPSLWDENRGIALNWTPAGASTYPSFRQQFPGVFILSPDPAVSIYDKLKAPGDGVPATFAALASDVKKYPNLLAHKLVTYTADNFFGYSAFWGLVKQHGWSALTTLGPNSTAEPDGTTMAQQIATGAANYGYFESGLIRGALTPTQRKLIGWLYMRDFTPLIPRGIAITQGAANPAAAKTFVNWLYSVTGQQVLCGAGFTAFRTGVTCPYSLASVKQAVGAANVYLIPYHSSIAQDRVAFVSRWHQIFG